MPGEQGAADGPAEQRGLGASLKEGCRRHGHVSIGVHERPLCPPSYALSLISRFCHTYSHFSSLAILRESDIFPSFDFRF